MGVKGLYTYLNQENSQILKELSIDELILDIKSYEMKYCKQPKILINLRSFNNYYERNIRDVIFAGRFTIIKTEFEKFLSILKNDCGAELIFVSKSAHTEENTMEQKQRKLNESFGPGMKFLAKIEEIDDVSQLIKHLRYHQFPWNDLTIYALAQSAQKFGTFHENDCFIKNKIPAHVETANQENVYAIIGLDTSLLFHKGSWKFIFPVPSRNRTIDGIAMSFKQYDKEKFLEHFEMNYDEIRLLPVLGGKFHSIPENVEKLESYFKTNNRKDFQKIKQFIKCHCKHFPLNDETIEMILEEIFGFCDENLMKDFKNCLIFEPTYVDVEERSKNKEFNDIIQNEIFSKYAEKILNNFPIIIKSNFLRVGEDTEKLKNLTLPFIKKTCGLVLHSFTAPKARKVYYRINETDWECIEIEPELPEIDIPDLKEMLMCEMGSEKEYQVLSFLIDDLISIEDLQNIPNEWILHSITVMLLVKHGVLSSGEAIVLTKAACEEVPRILYYPRRVNTKALNISIFYQEIYFFLLLIFGAVGLKCFSSEMYFDNVFFQIKYNELDKDEKAVDGEILDQILKIINSIQREI